MLDAIVEKVGEGHIMQVVTDNVANYKVYGETLMEKRAKLFWNPCVTHCIDLNLKDLDKKIKVYSDTIAKAKRVTTCIYSRTLVLTRMRECTKGKELIRPRATCFAASFMTLRCLNEQKSPLLSWFSYAEWRNNKFEKAKDGKRIARIVLDTRGLCSNVVACLNRVLPLLKVLRTVD